MNGRDQLKRTNYRAIEGYDSQAPTEKEAGAATYLARLYGRFDLPRRMYLGWPER